MAFLDFISTLTKIDFHNDSFVYYINVNVKLNNKQVFNTKMREQLKSACTNNDMNPII